MDRANRGPSCRRIVSAAYRRKRSLLLPWPTKMAIFLQRHFPWVVYLCDRPRVSQSDPPAGSGSRGRSRQDGGLAPAPFHQNIATVAVNPTMGYPPGVRPWRNIPTAWYPYVGAVHIVVIAANPNIVWTRGRRPCFDNCRGWPTLITTSAYSAVPALKSNPKGRTDQ
jgi:hypothetical protein